MNHQFSSTIYGNDLGYKWPEKEYRILLHFPYSASLIISF